MAPQSPHRRARASGKVTVLRNPGRQDAERAFGNVHAGADPQSNAEFGKVLQEGELCE